MPPKNIGRGAPSPPHSPLTIFDWFPGSPKPPRRRTSHHFRLPMETLPVHVRGSNGEVSRACPLKIAGCMPTMPCNDEKGRLATALTWYQLHDLATCGMLNSEAQNAKLVPQLTGCAALSCDADSEPAHQTVTGTDCTISDLVADFDAGCTSIL